MQLEDIVQDLYGLLKPYKVDPEYPQESADFFTQIASAFEDREACLSYISANLEKWFRVLTKSPEWIQGDKWQFSDGKPMVFVGQIEVPPIPRLFHDDASFYVFWNPDNGETSVVIQVS